MTSAVPDFSVIIPTYNRPETLALCLDALARLDTAGPTFEVLVVDDGGDAVLEPLIAARKPGLAVTLLRQRHAGPGAARNTGIWAARGRWLAFTDDDCLPEPVWLSAFAKGFARAPACSLGGRTINLAEANLYCEAHQLLVDYVTRSAEPGGAPRFFASNNQAFPAEPLRAIGGFDPTFPFAAGEDRDLCDRWLAAGFPLAEAPDAVVRHGHPMRLGRFCRMHHRYGRGARRFRRTSAARNGGRAKLEPITFYLGLVLSPLQQAPVDRAPSLCAALLLSQVCHATGYAQECLSRYEVSAERSAAGRVSPTSPTNRRLSWLGEKRDDVDLDA